MALRESPNLVSQGCTHEALGSLACDHYRHHICMVDTRSDNSLRICSQAATREQLQLSLSESTMLILIIPLTGMHH